MAFHVRDEASDLAIRRLAKLKRKTLTETILEDCEREYAREAGCDDFMVAVRRAQTELDAISQPGGLPANKAFYDELSGEEEVTGFF